VYKSSTVAREKGGVESLPVMKPSVVAEASRRDSATLNKMQNPKRSTAQQSGGHTWRPHVDVAAAIAMANANEPVTSSSNQPPQQQQTTPLTHSGSNVSQISTTNSPGAGGGANKPGIVSTIGLASQQQQQQPQQPTSALSMPTLPLTDRYNMRYVDCFFFFFFFSRLLLWLMLLLCLVCSLLRVCSYCAVFVYSLGSVCSFVGDRITTILL
jgi:hypothetical protein